MGNLLRGLAVAVAFLTRIPAGVGVVTETDLRIASAWFPFVGGLVGLVAGGAYALSLGFLPSLLAATMAVSLGIVVTGAIHEDGLADTADAFGSGAVGPQALEVMDDSRVGTYGAMALIVSMVWRVAALASLGPTSGVVALVVAHALSRAGAVVLLELLPPAKTDGLASSLAAGSSPPATLLAAATAILAAAALLGWWVMPVIVVVALAVAWSGRAAWNKLGGLTGDVLGACQQLAEMATLALMAAFAWRGVELWWY